MKIVWTIVALLLIAGLVVILQPPAPTRLEGAAEVEAAAAAAERAIVAADQTATPRESAGADAARKPAESDSAASTDSPTVKESTTATTATAGTATPGTATPGTATPGTATPGTATPGTATSQPGADALAKGAESGATAGPTTAVEPKSADAASTESKPSVSNEPPPPSPEALAAGAEFTPEVPRIEHAEILPSRFVRLADGAISVDDAWTIRGEGTDESPYEVSWEFLSSAQETYVPRLSEKKIPARIAFLHGKVVRISGYLAFPLVAPTSSECLAMLNQWDGCCIGIPPTPYDAIEVKLATELKGWKKHTINFGAITGVFKVEPYLVENWLVGLYLMEKSRLNTEL
jgi:hypothetical protein